MNAGKLAFTLKKRSPDLGKSFSHVFEKLVLGRYGISEEKPASRPNRPLTQCLIPAHEGLFQSQFA